MAYNHFGMYKHTCSECFSLLWRKIKQIYPSYLFGFGLAVVYLMLTDDPQLALNPGAAINMTVNLAMLQAWFEPIAFSFNGASWFISALMLCYFFTPFIDCCVNRSLVWTRSKVKGLLIVVVVCVTVSALFEAEVRLLPDIYRFSLHSWPPVCLVRYALGYASAVFLPSIQDYAKRHDLSWALFECAIVAFIIFTVVWNGSVWWRIAYVIELCALCLVLSCGGGVFHRLLSVRPLVVLSSFELYFYLFHQPIIWIAKYVLNDIFPRRYWAFAAFILTALLAVLFRFASRYMSGKLTITKRQAA